MKTRKERLMGPPLVREAALPDDAIMDDEARTIRVTFSSEEPVLRRSFFEEPWWEVLGHGADEVDLERLLTSAPVFYNHNRFDPSQRIGVVERAWVEDGRGHAEIRLSQREDVAGIWQDIRDGVLRNVSVGYRINERVLQEERDGEPATYRVTSWEPMEISVVDIPADPTVGVGRSSEPETYRITPVTDEREDEAMSGNTKQQPTVGNEDAREERQDAPPETQRQEPSQEQLEAERKRALEAEQARRQQVREIFEPFLERGEHVQKALDKALDDYQVDSEAARKLLLDELGRGVEPVGNANVRVEAGESEGEKFWRGAESAMLARSGLAKDDTGNELRGFTLLELARRSLELSNVRTERFDKMELVARAFTHTTSDYTNLLANVASKAMLMGWGEAEETYERWTRAGTLPDFKEARRVDLNAFPSLSEVPEGAEYKHASIGDRGETIQLATYGRLFAITRQAIINDDLDAFTRIPARMGRAARRTIGNLVYAVLTDNPTMSDGTALFHADHNNLASSGGAPSTSTFDAARTAMATQKDPDENVAALNISPAFAIVPKALEGAARVVVESETEIASGQNNSRRPNSVRNMVDVVADARLDADSASAYYFAANPTMHDTVEVAYLDGVRTPTLEQQDGWRVDGAEYKVRIDAGVKALDFRTFFKNPGA